MTADFITEEEKKLSGTTVIILIAFVFYLAMMIVIGAVYMKKTSSSEDYFLGGRGLNGWVAALSAQASDMSGWLLMGLPGAIYSFGSIRNFPSLAAETLPPPWRSAVSDFPK